MNSKGCAADQPAAGHPLGNLTPLATADGSLSLHSDLFAEAFHCSAGALGEAKAKFVAPAQLERFGSRGDLRVLDVCVGLGYNSAALMEALRDVPSLSLQWWGLELDPRPLHLALGHAEFVRLWSEPVLHRLEALRDRGGWNDQTGSGQMLWGDARKQLQALRHGPPVDLVLMDAFSPNRCPELWSEEFLHGLAEQLAPGGRLLTYSRAAAVRGSLRRAGLELRSLLPAPGQRKEWSSGTLASRPDPQQPLAEQGPGWTPLSPMEEDHLLTRASVPYRDLGGNDSAAEIKQRREQEQQHCDLISTSSWQRLWRQRGHEIGSS